MASLQHHFSSDFQRKDATVQVILRNYSEQLKAAVLQSCSQDAQTLPTFTPPAQPAGYSVTTSPALGANPNCPNPTILLTITASHTVDGAGNPSVPVSASLQIALSVP